MQSFSSNQFRERERENDTTASVHIRFVRLQGNKPGKETCKSRMMIFENFWAISLK